MNNRIIDDFPHIGRRPKGWKSFWSTDVLGNPVKVHIHINGNKIIQRQHDVIDWRPKLPQLRYGDEEF